MFGGSSGSNAAYTGIKHDNTYEYDPSTDTWTEKKNMPTARSGVSAAVIDSKIYVVGGYFTTGGKLTRTNKVEIYDPKTDSWENVPDMPTARSWTSVVAVGKQLYVFGGGNNSNVAVDTTECFDTETNTWSTKKNMPYTANAPAGEVIDGKVYLIGGSDYSVSNNSIIIYDPQQDSWNSIESKLMKRVGHKTVKINDKVYILGGYTGGKIGLGELISSVEIFDPKTETITTLKDLTFPRTEHTSVQVNGNIYIIGGTVFENDGILSTVEMYSVESPEPEPEPKPDPNPEPEQPKGDRAILVVTMNTGLEKEFDLSMEEVNAFISWYENKQAGTGTASYAVNKHNNNKGPFSSRKDYVIFDKILTFEVNEYSIK